MDTTPDSPTQKRPRPKIVVKKATTKAVRKAPASRAASTKSRAAESAVNSPIDLHNMIETAAFFLAAERNFAAGHELEDWLEAERRIKRQHPL